MRAILEFELPEEADEHRHALAGADLAGVILDLDHELRALHKHAGKQTIPVEAVRERIRDLLRDRNLLWILG